MNDTGSPTSAEVEAMIAAAEARTDTKFAQLLGEVKAANLRLDHIAADLREVKESRRSLTITVIGTGIGAAAVIIAALAYGAAWFGLGINAHDVAFGAAKQAVEQYQRNEPMVAPPAIPQPK